MRSMDTTTLAIEHNAAIPVATANDAVLAFSPFAEGHRWFAKTQTAMLSAPSEGDARLALELTATQQANA